MTGELVFKQPKTFDERKMLARTLVDRLRYRIPVAIDSIDGRPRRPSSAGLDFAPLVVYRHPGHFADRWWLRFLRRAQALLALERNRLTDVR